MTTDRSNHRTFARTVIMHPLPTRLARPRGVAHVGASPLLRDPFAGPPEHKRSILEAKEEDCRRA